MVVCVGATTALALVAELDAHGFKTPFTNVGIVEHSEAPGADHVIVLLCPGAIVGDDAVTVTTR